MKSRFAAALLLPLFAAACAPAVNTGSMATTAGDMNAVFPGSIFAVQLDQPLGGTLTGATGSTLTARVIEPLHTAAGDVVIPRGATVEGTIVAYYPSGGSMPEMVSVEFDRIRIDDASFPITGNVVHVDLNLADDDAPSWPAGIASMANPADLYPGTVIADAAEFLQENELGPNPASVISLGFERGTVLPRGARLTLEFLPGMSM
jgi:hypothetical protein